MHKAVRRTEGGSLCEAGQRKTQCRGEARRHRGAAARAGAAIAAGQDATLRFEAAAASARDNDMDEATKHGYGVLLLRQGLPKSQFYANVVRRLNAGNNRPPAPGITPHLPFAPLGKASNAPSINAAERDRRLQALHDAARRPARGRDTGIDGRDAATQQLYERLVHILDGPVADGVKETKALRADAGKNAASAKEASASLERAVEAAADRVAARVDAVAAAVAELRPDVKAVKAEVKALGPYAAGQKSCPRGPDVAMAFKKATPVF